MRMCHISKSMLCGWTDEMKPRITRDSKVGVMEDPSMEDPSMEQTKIMGKTRTLGDEKRPVDLHMAALSIQSVIISASFINI